MDKTINTNTNANANTNTNIKQPKEFEEEIKFNPEFIGLFRNELLRCELKDDNNNILYNDISSVNSDVNNETDVKNETNENSIKVLHINTKSNKPDKPDKPDKPETIIDTLEPLGEIKDFSKIKKILKEQNSVTSSTLISHDDMKNIVLDEYETYKLKEIIKYFVNIKK
jgi:hypothetical protein